MMLFKLKQISGYTIRAADGDMGKVKTVYFDDRTWAVRYLVVDTGNWLAEHLVLLHPTCLTPPNEEKKMIAVSVTKKQVEAGPGIEQDKPVSQQQLADLHAYYEWPIFWAGGLAAHPGTFAQTMIRPESDDEDDDGDPHLRSAREVTGYAMLAADEEIGSVSDFIVDTTKWKLRYVIVDTGNWLPGKKVLMSPHWITSVNWSEAAVTVKMSKNAVHNSPAYDPSMPLTQEYEKKLYAHYGRSLEWERRHSETAVL